MIKNDKEEPGVSTELTITEDQQNWTPQQKAALVQIGVDRATEGDLWAALDHVHLGATVRARPGQLDAPVDGITELAAVLKREQGRRVIEGGAAHEPRTSETAPWVTGVLAAVQAAIASLALLVLPAVIVFVLSSGEPTNQGVEWTTSASTGAGLWLLALGVPLTTAEFEIT